VDDEVVNGLSLRTPATFVDWIRRFTYSRFEATTDSRPAEWDRWSDLWEPVGAMASLVRYWLEFDWTDSPAARLTPWWGVTARTVEDARGLILGTTRFGQSLPPVIQLIEDVDVSTLDQDHVARNMLDPNERGIWYPLGFQ
jgi:hypothetical protein